MHRRGQSTSAYNMRWFTKQISDARQFLYTGEHSGIMESRLPQYLFIIPILPLYNSRYYIGTYRILSNNIKLKMHESMSIYLQSTI